MKTNVNAFGGTVLTLTTLVLTLSLIIEAIITCTDLLPAFETQVIVPYLIDKIAGVFAFALVYFMGCLTLKVYHKEPLKLWLLKSIAWLPFIALCAIMAEIIFYDSPYAIGGALARSAAEWLTIRLTHIASIITLFLSATLYAWLMLHVYGKDHHFSLKFLNNL